MAGRRSKGADARGGAREPRALAGHLRRHDHPAHGAVHRDVRDQPGRPEEVRQAARRPRQLLRPAHRRSRAATACWRAAPRRLPSRTTRSRPRSPSRASATRRCRPSRRRRRRRRAVSRPRWRRSASGSLAALTKQGLADAVQFQTKEQRGLVVNIVTDRVLFDLGEATLRPQGAKVLDAIAPALKNLPNEMVDRGAHRQPADQRRAVRLQLGAVHATRDDRPAAPADPRARRAQGRSRRVRRPAPARAGLQRRQPGPEPARRHRHPVRRRGRGRVDRKPVLRRPAVPAVPSYRWRPRYPQPPPYPPHRPLQEPDMPTATVTVTEVPAADVAAPPRSRKKLFLVIGLVVLLLGAGGFFAKGLLGGPPRPSPTRRPSPARWRRSRRSPSTSPTGATSSSPWRCSSARRRGWRRARSGRVRRSRRPSTAPRRSTPRSTCWAAGPTPSCWPPAAAPVPRRRCRRRCASGTTGTSCGCTSREFLMQ